ncbi:molybdenum cofactor guanylyltransferase [Croceicoccus hydrothermalis]|uniref:molybdenum cofactor guanylyltransferase n=1 Tax=Croceicoccus hydrothermalis TaxID=2867964 RepID=UPI001EFB68F8|nr:molybdenum cofactor guanylyltransferase [Croceicoccus hydrothermalis]
MMADMLMGCVLAGGQSRRFGSDKALALLDGETLIDRAVRQLRAWCGDVVVAGRVEAPATTVADWPAADMGPLGGLAGALRHARDGGYGAVLACGVDSVGLPADTPALLSPGPACFSSQPVVGLWPVTTLPVLERLLTGPGRNSFVHFAQLSGARMVDAPCPPANINTPADLADIGKTVE